MQFAFIKMHSFGWFIRGQIPKRSSSQWVEAEKGRRREVSRLGGGVGVALHCTVLRCAAGIRPETFDPLPSCWQPQNNDSLEKTVERASLYVYWSFLNKQTFLISLHF